MTTPQQAADAADAAVAEAERVQRAFQTGEIFKLELEVRYALKELGRSTDLLMANALLSIAADQFADHPPDLLANLMRGLQTASREGLEAGALCRNYRCRAAKDLSRRVSPKVTHCAFCGAPL